MSFGSGGFGFGANNQQQQQQQPQQQSSGFGGFGASNTNTGGFGQTQTTGFGSNTNAAGGGGLFGSGGSSFGSGGFGANKPAFGAAAPSTSGGGLFGNTTATTASTGFGGFGAGTNTSSGFGTNNATTGGSLFGAAKPAFGGSTGTGAGLFGNSAASTTGGGFGAGTTQSGGLFGATPGATMGANTAECPGTGGTPFQAYTEKEPSSNMTNHFQSITFMQPYQKYSFEETRVADYNQGRRYGNSNGQAGAFGTSTGFGGFGQSSQQANTGFGNKPAGGLFGATTTTTAGGFGSTPAPAGGFGGAAGGGLFGNSKPATGGLFGNTPAATTPQQSGGLFGTTGGFGNTQSTTFGASNTASTGGGLFAGNQNNQQKPGGLFGGTTTTTPGGFGAAATGGAFGNNQASGGGGLFGGNTQNQAQGTSLFGGQSQPAATGGFGAGNTQSSFGGGFGANQQKPGGLFGNTTTKNPSCGGNFRGGKHTNTQQPAGGLFGGGNAGANTGGSLFNKPAAGTSLFNAPASNTAGGGLFGGANNQTQQQGGGLFGASNNQQEKPSLFGGGGNTGGLFGANTNQQGNTNSLFGGQGAQNQSSLFGGGNAGAGTSLFGSSQQNALQPPQVRIASINDSTPYGSSSIFNGLPPPPQNSVGPIATPISGQKLRKPAALPQYKINPGMASRLITPQKRGYGFSYSNYGTPSSASSATSTPGGLSNSFLGGSIGRSLGKSFSTSNLRRTFDSDGDSILSPGAFSASGSRYSSTGSMKRLIIDRSLRTDLFGSGAVAALPAPERQDSSKTPLKKKVSFDAGTVGGNGNGNGSGAERETNGDASNNASRPTAEELGFARSSRTNGRSKAQSAPSTMSSTPEMSEVRGNELAIVPEDRSSEESNNDAVVTRSPHDQTDPEPGRYWIKPSVAELKRMSKDQLRKVSGVQLGRERCGFCAFNEPVDLTTVDLDNIFGVICDIKIRSLTIYPDNARKPPVGKGLNVPSTITLENSWPRQRDKKTPTYETSGPRFAKHVDRLRRIGTTTFVAYNKDTGDWVFRVPHFTTYGLDYDDEDDETQVSHLESSALSEAPPTDAMPDRTPRGRDTPMVSRAAHGSSGYSDDQVYPSSEPEDTFGYKKKRMLPGAFDESMAIEVEPEMREATHSNESFLVERSADSQSEDDEDEPGEHETPKEIDDESVDIHEDPMNLVGSFPINESDSLFMPKSILKTSRFEALDEATPRKATLQLDDDWAAQLQRTISPRKQDRQALKESQLLLFKDQDVNVPELKPQPIARGGGEITTSIDLMNALFGEEARRSKGPKPGTKNNGFQV